MKVGERGVEVDDKLRTSVKRSTRRVTWRAVLFTHSAGYEAARAVRNMFLPGSGGGDYLVPWCTFTDPARARRAHRGAGARRARRRRGAGLVAGSLALRPGAGRLRGRRRDQDRHREGPHRRRACARPERRRADRRARPGDPPQAQAHGPREPGARLSDDRDRDPADRRRGRLRVGAALLPARPIPGVFPWFRAGRARGPGGWRATKPALLRMSRDQRVPLPRFDVSKRQPATTMYACPAFAYTVIHLPGPASPQLMNGPDAIGELTRPAAASA